MAQQFTAAEQDYLNETLPRVIATLTEDVMARIRQAEADANAGFAAKGIVFTEHSAANAEYLCVALMENLFDSLHKGDKALASHMLSMMAKRLGISVP